MNRRMFTPRREPGWELAKGVAIFLIALAVSALVSINEVEMTDDTSQEP